MCPAHTAPKRSIEKSINSLIPHLSHDTRHLTDATICRIEQLLDFHEDLKQWSDKPRLFTLLRMLKYDDNTLKQFLDAGINDYFLPINEDAFRGLGVTKSAECWDEFERAQRYILLGPDDTTKSSLQDKPDRHRNLEYGDLVFKDAGVLDRGATATVSRVQLTPCDSAGNGRLYACKRLMRWQGTKQQKPQLQLFMDELQILRKISHPHTVRLVTSYTDLEVFALVLDPVADKSLRDMLNQASSIPLNLADLTNLRQWFGCLASALVHLHDKNVRHKDIKPSNVLLRNGTVYLCDFGISFDWTGFDPTTEGPSPRTPGYCAPEVLDAKARDTSSDVWSLGRVFCDMLTILAGKPMTELLERIGGNLRNIYDEDCLEDLHKWLSDFPFENTPHDPLARDIQQLVKKMMHKNPNLRPNAKRVVQWFCKSNHGLIGPCCETVVHVEPEATPTRQLPAVPLTPIAGDYRTPILDEFVTTTLPIPQALAQAKQQEKADKKAAEEEKKAQEEADKKAKEEEKKAKEEEKKAAEEQKKAEKDAKKKEEADAKAAEEQADKKATEDEKKQQEEDKVNDEPVDPQHTCNCVPRTSCDRGKERLILCLPNVGLLINAKQPTMETNEKCGLHEDMLYVYESNTERSKIWLKTRRLVVSYKHESHSQRICSSFWLPLTDVNFVVEDMSLALRWSDCNQWNPGPTVNNKQSWDCIYDSEKPNNEIVLLFAKAGIAKVVETGLCTIYSKLDGVKECRMVDIVGQQRLLVVDLTDNETINYRLACLATYELPFKSTFRAFIHWSNLDLDIQIKSDVMVIRFDQVSTPHYYSQIKNEPWKEESKIGQYTESALVLGGYSITFPCSFDNSTFLPEGLKPTLESLTGWTICFFASDVEIRKVNTLSKTSYRDSDVILWKRCSEGQSCVRQMAQITFRHRDRRSDWDYLWRSGSVDATRKATFGSQKAAISVSDKSHGIQLDTTTMTAIEVNENGKPISKPYDNSFTKLELLFGSESDLTEFMIRYRELQQVVKSYALLRVPTKASSRLSSSSRRRDSGTAHTNQRAS